MKRNANHAHRFATFADLVDATKRAPIAKVGTRAHTQALCMQRGDLAGGVSNGAVGSWSSASWFGLDSVTGQTPTKVYEHLLTGWDEGVRTMRSALGELTLPTLKSVRRRGRWADIGDELGIDRFMAGDFDTCWRTNVRAACGTPPRVQIVVNASMNSLVKGTEAFWRGAAATVVAEACVAAGYSTKVDCVYRTDGYDPNGSQNYVAFTTAKDYDTPFSVSTCTALTAHPATFRVITFAHIFAQAPLDVTGGIGHATTVSADDMLERGWLDPGAIALVIPGHVLTPEAARQWIAQTVAMLEERAGEQAA